MVNNNKNNNIPFFDISVNFSFPVEVVPLVKRIYLLNCSSSTRKSF